MEECSSGGWREGFIRGQPPRPSIFLQRFGLFYVRRKLLICRLVQPEYAMDYAKELGIRKMYFRRLTPSI